VLRLTIYIERDAFLAAEQVICTAPGRLKCDFLVFLVEIAFYDELLVGEMVF
jgi:hypothetical protein